MKKQFIDQELESTLKNIAELLGDLNRVEEKKSKLETEQDQMTEEQNRLRENIKVLGESTQEATLREKYVNKLTLQENRFEEIKAEIKKLENQIGSLNREIEEKINKLTNS